MRRTALKRTTPLKAKTPLRPISKKRLLETQEAGPAIARQTSPIKRKVRVPKGQGKPKKKVTSIRTLDMLFSQYIREKAGECEVCFGNCSTQYQCSHIKSRRFQSTRWLPENAVCQTAACHRHAHNNPDLFIRAIEEKWPGRIDKINEVWLKGEKPDREALAAWLRAELVKLRA